MPQFLHTCDATTKEEAKNLGVSITRTNEELIEKVVEAARQHYADKPVLIITRGAEDDELIRVYKRLLEVLADDPAERMGVRERARTPKLSRKSSARLPASPAPHASLSPRSPCSSPPHRPHPPLPPRRPLTTRAVVGALPSFGSTHSTPNASPRGLPAPHPACPHPCTARAHTRLDPSHVAGAPNTAPTSPRPDLQKSQSMGGYVTQLSHTSPAGGPGSSGRRVSIR